MPNPSIITNLEKLLGGPRDGPLLRYSLGNEYLKADDPGRAAEHLRAALATDPRHSAAWKLLAKALTTLGDVAGAQAAYREGIAVAEAKGDVQAAKEMKVFLRRLDKAAGGAG
ncbi:MAG: tetratricopeptide repeat protein [Zoogloeaceae bacterium]|nr:tetratricopeptide repeat protein [Zoogloeaceae bacterium]